MNPAVQIIPGTQGIRGAEQRIIRACAYGRVSTEEESQELSYATQKQFYTDFITSQEGYEFAGFYGDEAISGTNRFKRHQFNQMIEDAKAHKFDVIFTKSISRFARNTLDTLTCIRDLKALTPPVTVFFEKENLNTGEGQSELVLTIMSAIAQEESRSISENIKWSLKRKLANGDPMVNLSRMIGYDEGEDGKWVINPEQAEIVRFIYTHYADGESAYSISQALNAMGKKTVLGNKWRSDSVMLILRSEKYVGDLESQKTYTPNFLTHESEPNPGNRYFVKDHHPAIVDRELDEKVKQMIGEMVARREENKGRVKPKSPMENLTLPDGTPLTRLTYRNPATDYRDEEGHGGYFFQYPVWKTANIAKIPNIGRAYVLEVAVQQSFMEMVYQIKADPSGVTVEVERLLRSLDDGKIGLIEKQINKARAEKKQAEEKGTEAYAELAADLGRKIERLVEQRGELLENGEAGRIRREFAAFMEAVRGLPDDFVVNTVDVEGSFFTEADGTPIKDRLSHYRSGKFSMNAERIAASPDLLPFDGKLYERFVKKGVVRGDEIEYEMTFGVRLISAGNDRTLRGFFGWKRTDDEGRVELLDQTWKVNNRKMWREEPRKRGKEEE